MYAAPSLSWLLANALVAGLGHSHQHPTTDAIEDGLGVLQDVLEVVRIVGGDGQDLSQAPLSSTSCSVQVPFSPLSPAEPAELIVAELPNA